jgi:hypothetical protein
LHDEAVPTELAMPHIYKPEERWDNADIGFPAALAIGDSWFWYVNNNILGTMIRHRALSDDYRNIQLVGYNGARLKDYVGEGKYADTVEHFLRPGFVEAFAAFFISGAGNDAVDVGLALHDHRPPGTDADGWIDDDGMDDMLFRLRQSLTRLVAGIRFAKRDSASPPPIFIHGYDYPVPDGRGFEFGLIHAGPWLAPALDAHGVPRDMALRSAIVTILIDRLNDDLLAPLAAATPGVVYIDSRGVLPRDGTYRDYWANELHPTNLGFRRIFEQTWLPRMYEHGIALRPAP